MENYNNFVFQNMITCLGNKRKLLSIIRSIIEEIKIFLSKDKLNIVDGFSGSNVVSREFSYFSNNLYTNDLEYYSFILAYCYLKTPNNNQKERIIKHIEKMNKLAEIGPFYEGIICNLYAPKNTNSILENERLFYTRENALIIDTLRNYIENEVEDDIQYYCLGPLIVKSSIHTNTCGIFKSFYKKFGGRNEDALKRIKQKIKLDIPVWNNTIFNSITTNKDINILINELPNNIDIIYLDPPYNQHPYGSNYFMLNVISENKEPENISKISGIPKNWKRSNYNYRETAIIFMKDLLEKSLLKSKFVLISYNNEGIIKQYDWKLLLHPYKTKKYEIDYNTFKGCKNLKNRNNKVLEILYLVSKN